MLGIPFLAVLSYIFQTLSTRNTSHDIAQHQIQFLPLGAVLRFPSNPLNVALTKGSTPTSHQRHPAAYPPHHSPTQSLDQLPPRTNLSHRQHIWPPIATRFELTISINLQPRIPYNLLPFRFIRPPYPHHNRHLQIQILKST